MLHFREWLVTEDQQHPDQAGFDAAIREHPGDHTNYLVYADWCQEHGHPWLEHWLRAVTDNGIAVAPFTASGGPRETFDPSNTGPVLLVPEFTTSGRPPATGKVYCLGTYEALNQKPAWTSTIAFRPWVLNPVAGPDDHPNFLMALCDQYNQHQSAALRDTIAKMTDAIEDPMAREAFTAIAERFLQPFDPRPLRPQTPAPARRRRRRT